MVNINPDFEQQANPEGLLENTAKRVDAATETDDPALKRLRSTQLVNGLNVAADVVDALPLFGADDAVAAGMKGVGAAIQTGEALIKGDMDAAQKAAAAGAIRTGVAAVPFAEYLTITDAVLGAARGKNANFSPEEIAGKAIDKLKGRKSEEPQNEEPGFWQNLVGRGDGPETNRNEQSWVQHTSSRGEGKSSGMALLN